MKKIKLTRGKFALVDDDDFKYLNQWKWHCNTQNYAVREQSLGKNKSKMIRMHRLINNTLEGFDTDHIDRNTLNNQRTNLRTVSHGKNMFNLKIAKNNKSGHRGISWHKETKKWRAYINLNRKQIYLGIYNSINQALLVRNDAEKKYHAI